MTPSTELAKVRKPSNGQIARGRAKRRPRKLDPHWIEQGRKLSRLRRPPDMSLEAWQVALRRQFGREQKFRVKNVGSQPVFSEFEVTNPQSGRSYRVAIRGLGLGDNFCSCPDFAVNTLGTCKHIEFTLAQIERVLQELPALGTVESVCFEGGEPFLHPALLLAGVERARMHGFKVGIVTNASWATSDEDAERQLRPLVAAGLGSITVSDDALHFGEITPTPAQRAMAAAQRLGMPSSAICIERPTVTRPTHEATG